MGVACRSLEVLLRGGNLQWKIVRGEIVMLIVRKEPLSGGDVKGWSTVLSLIETIFRGI